MPSYELEPFTPNRNLRVIGAIEILPPSSLRVMFWVIDPEQQVLWPSSADNLASCISANQQEDELGYARRHYLWQQTCFELFIGLKNKSTYREINLSSAEVWNCYQFEDYRQPSAIPPMMAQDIQLLELKTQPQKLEAVINLQLFLQQQHCQWNDLVIGVSSIMKTRKNHEIYFALQHSGKQPDFHQKSDWIMSL